MKCSTLNSREFEKEFERIAFDHEEDEVVIIGLKDIEEKVIDGFPLNIKKDKPLKLPYWMAKGLVEEGIARMDHESEITIQELDRLLLEENNSFALQGVEKEIYNSIRDRIESIKNQQSTAAYRELQLLEGMFNQLLQQRLKKILKISEHMATPSSLRNLLPEEKVLHEWINRIVREWKRKVGLHSTTLEDTPAYLEENE